MASTSGTSYITTASEQAVDLYESNRDYNNKKTWESLYNNNDVEAAKAQQELTNEYTDASVQAYVSYLQSQQSLQNSNIVGASKSATMDAYESSLQSTKSSLYSSYYDAQSQIEELRSEQEESISEALWSQSEYTADYINAHYDYLQYLWDEYLQGNNKIFDSTIWQKYIGYEYATDSNGNPIYDKGTGEYELDYNSPYLKSWSELSTTTTDDNGEYMSVYDENGNLTQFGIDLFDQLENSWDVVTNSEKGNNSMSWSDWLKDFDQDVYDWASSYNYYNYTQAGTNAGTVRTSLGMMSTDMTYSYLERFGGMTSAQVDSYFSKVDDAIQAAYDAADVLNSKTKAKYITAADNAALAVIDAMDELVNDLNLGASFEAEGFSWDSIKENMTEYISSSLTQAKSAKTTTITGGISTGGGLATILGASIGLGVAGISTAGIGFLVAGLGIAVLGIVQLCVAGSSNKENAAATHDAIYNIMDQLAVDFADYTHTIKTTYGKGNSYQIIY